MKKSKCCNSIEYKQEAGNYFCTHCISICNTRMNLKPIFRLFSIIILLTSINCYAPSENSQKLYPKALVTRDTCDIELIDSCIYKELVKQKIIHPELVLSQAKLESGNYKSKIAKENKNIFGIKYINRKPYQKGELNGHALYSSVKDCILDFKLTQRYYLENIEKRYSETKGYSERIKKM